MKRINHTDPDIESIVQRDVTRNVTNDFYMRLYHIQHEHYIREERSKHRTRSANIAIAASVALAIASMVITIIIVVAK